MTHTHTVQNGACPCPRGPGGRREGIGTKRDKISHFYIHTLAVSAAYIHQRRFISGPLSRVSFGTGPGDADVVARADAGREFRHTIAF